MCPHCLMTVTIYSLPVIGLVVMWWKLRKMRKPNAK